jgi:hypothetical protein
MTWTLQATESGKPVAITLGFQVWKLLGQEWEWLSWCWDSVGWEKSRDAMLGFSSSSSSHLALRGKLGET